MPFGNSLAIAALSVAWLKSLAVRWLNSGSVIPSTKWLTVALKTSIKIGPIIRSFLRMLKSSLDRHYGNNYYKSVGSWEEFWSKRTNDLKRKSRDAGIDIPLRYGVFLTSVDDDHLTTVIDLWHGSIASAFVDHGTLTEEATYRYALERIKEASFPLDQIMLVPKHGDISTLRKLNTHFLTDCQVTENSAEDTWIQKEGQDISWDFNCQDTRHHVFSQSNVIELESDHGTTQTLQSHFSFDTAQESMAARLSILW